MKPLITLALLLLSTSGYAMFPDKPSKANANLKDKPPINFTVDRWKEIECMAVAMVGEAKHTSHVAMQDVGIAILSRVNHGDFASDNACEAVYERKQFSFLIVDVERFLAQGKTTVFDKKGKPLKYSNWDKDWNKVDFNTLHKSVFNRYVKVNPAAMSQAVGIADRLLTQNTESPIMEFTNYYGSYLDRMGLTPDWAKSKNMSHVKTEHEHKFYLLNKNG